MLVLKWKFGYICGNKINHLVLEIQIKVRKLWKRNVGV